MNNVKIGAFLKDLLSLSAGTLIYMLVGFIGTPIITRLVDPVDYGSMSILTVYSSMGLMFLGMGLDQTILRFFYKEEGDYRRKLIRICCAIPMGAAVTVGAAVLLAHILGKQWLTTQELILLEVNVLALILNRFALLVLRLQSRTNAHSAANIIQKTAYILITILLILYTECSHFLALAAATVASTLLAAIAAILMERDLWKRPERDYVFSLKVSELLRYGMPIMLASSIHVIFGALDKLFIQHYCTLTDVGVYASAMNLMAIFNVVRTSFNAIWMPTAVAHYEKEPHDKRFYQQGNTVISVLMLCFGAAIVLCKDLFVLLLGEKYRAASLIVPFLMFEPIMYTISETTATGIVVQKKPVSQVIIAGGACLCNFLGNWLLTPLLGPQGAAISTGLSYIVFFILRTALSNRVYYVDYQLPRFAFALAALMAFAAYGSTHNFGWEQVLMFAGVLSAVAAAYRKDVWAILKNLILEKKTEGDLQ